MLQITKINNGLVIDHIKPGMGIKIFNYLELDKVGNQVALIINADSKAQGKKDIIKIEKVASIDYTVLGLLSPNLTINEVRDEEITKKIKPELPSNVTDIIKCSNVRCITADEDYVPHLFKIVDAEKGTYRCEYCDHIMMLSEM